MSPVKCLGIVLGLATLCFEGLSPHAFGQGAVAFDPVVGMVPSGQTMTVTPAVSADRRYVRLSVNAFFNTFNGFTSFNTPLGAVGGVGASGGGLGGGGLGGLGGGLGGVGGLRSVGGFGAGGETFDAGMNGVVGPAGFDRAVGYAANGMFGQIGEMRAGAFPDSDDFSSGMSYPGLKTGTLGKDDVKTHVARPSRPPAADTARPEGSRLPSTSATTTAAARQSVPKAVARREKARSARAARAKKASDEEPVVKPKATSLPGSAD